MCTDRFEMGNPVATVSMDMLGIYLKLDFEPHGLTMPCRIGISDIKLFNLVPLLCRWHGAALDYAGVICAENEVPVPRIRVDAQRTVLSTD